MKNRRVEHLRRKTREYHRHHPWRLNRGVYIPHAYPEAEAEKLSWWDDVGFILGGRRVIVFWRHPRCVYHDAIASQAMTSVPAPNTPSTLEELLSGRVGMKRWRRVGRSRKKLVSETMPETAKEWSAFYDTLNEREAELERVGIDFEIAPSMRVRVSATATTVELVAPIEVRSENDARDLAVLAKRLLKRETTIDDEWPGYRYGRDAWLSEVDLRSGGLADAVITPRR